MHQSNVITPQQLKTSNHQDNVVKDLRKEYQEYNYEVLRGKKMDNHNQSPNPTAIKYEYEIKNTMVELHLLLKSSNDITYIESIELNYDANVFTQMKKNVLQLQMKKLDMVRKKIGDSLFYMFPINFCSDEYPLPFAENNKITVVVYKKIIDPHEIDITCPDLLLTTCTEKFADKYIRKLYPYMMYQEQEHPILNRRNLTIPCPVKGIATGILIYLDGFLKIKDAIDVISFYHGNHKISETNLATISNYEFNKMTILDGTVFMFVFTTDKVMDLHSQIEYLKEGTSSYVDMNNIRDIEISFTFKPVNPKKICIVCPTVCYAYVKNNYLFTSEN